MLSLDDILPSKTLSQYGMDSLVAVEMRNWIFRKFSYTIPVLEHPSSNSLAKLARTRHQQDETENTMVSPFKLVFIDH